MTSPERPLAWAPTAHYRRLVTVALVPLLATMVLGRPGYLVLAAPALAALALAARRPRDGASVGTQVSGDRCFESEEITVSVNAVPAGPAAATSAQLVLPRALEIIDGPPAHTRSGSGPVEARWRVRALRWGRWDFGQVLVTVRSPGGLYAGRALVGLGEITVFPHPPPLTQLALPAELHTRIGDHVDRRPGEGAEFAGVRQFTPGDRLRRVNWPVTTRRGALHVNQLAAERAAEIVALIDAMSDAGPPGDSTLDRAVRGATGLARAYTRAGDRVGVITLYGPLRWLAPGSGQRQFFTIAEQVLETRGLFSYVVPDVARIPPAVLPPGALVVFFSPLLEERAIDTAINLRERGHAVIIVDMLATIPDPGGTSTGALALRVWRLERQALRYRLESLGIPVTGWPGEPRDAAASTAEQDSLNAALGRFARRRVRGGVR